MPAAVSEAYIGQVFLNEKIWNLRKIKKHMEIHDKP